MILHCNFEELRALLGTGEALATGETSLAGAEGAAISHLELARIERLLPRLGGDLSIETLDDQRGVRAAVGSIVRMLHARLDARITELGPGHDESINTYFDYGHARAVLAKLDLMGVEMHAIIDVIGGDGGNLASAITFPD